MQIPVGMPSNRTMATRATKRKIPISPRTLLTKVSEGRSVASYRSKQVIFSQGDPADAVFYIQKGRVKLTVVSKQGKEAIVALLGADEFFGEGCMAGQPLRISTARATEEATVLRLYKKAMVRLLHTDPTFSEFFTAHVLSRNIRIEEDLVDQLFNSSEKRLARILLLLAHFGKEGKLEPVIPKHQSRNTVGNDRNNPVAGQPLHEQIPQARVHRLQRLQRRHAGSQFTPQHNPS